MELKTPDPKIIRKAERLISKGDSLFAKEKFEKALKKYREAMQLHPDAPGLFEKLQAALDRLEREWDLEEFAESLDATMRKQAQEHPAVKQAHAKLSPEWKRVSELVIQLMNASDADQVQHLTEEIVKHGEVATRVMIDIIQHIGKETYEEDRSDW